MLIIWFLVFIASLLVLVKSADWFLESSEKIGLALGLSPFIAGVIIVGFGTSLPELASGIAAVIAGASEVVVANAVGSNIANILLVVGFSVVFARGLSVSKSLIDLDLPLLAIATVLFLGAVFDGVVTTGEAFLLLVTYAIYLLYSFLHPAEEVHFLDEKNSGKQPTTALDIFFFILGALGLVISAKYLIESVISLSELIGISVGVIALVAVAFGTSVPELVVSIKAALRKKPDIALGNIFGSNVFNLLVVVGIPGLLANLSIDEKTFAIGLPILSAATILFIFSGISRRLHLWEGAMYLILYVFFLGKLFNLL